MLVFLGSVPTEEAGIVDLWQGEGLPREPRTERRCRDEFLTRMLKI